LDRSVPAVLGVQVDEGAIRVTRPSDERQDRALHGLARSLIANMVTGVTEGFTQILELRGVGYRAEVQGRKLVLQAGFSHPVELEPPVGIEVETQQLSPTSDSGYLAAVITCRGIDKQLLGDFVDSVRSVRPVEPYKGKGIRFRGERVRRKLGKAAKTGGS
jgi:large subunit ribosomal protein L6